MTKRKPKRLRDHARAHPWITLTSIATVVGIAAAIVPYVPWPHFQTAEAADAHAKQDAREFAALIYGQQRIETLLLRQKVNECRARVKPAERLICAEYEQEFRAAAQRERALYEQVLKNK